MGTVVRHSCFFLLLLVLSISEIHAREIAGGANNIETAYESKKTDDHLCLNHAHDDEKNDGIHGCHKYAPTSSSSTHMDPSWNMFFHHDDLKVGKRIPLYFPIKDPSTVPHMISKEEANSIPFSLDQLPQILDFFSFPQDSPQANAIKETLKHCEQPPINGEKKICVTSLESMLDNLGQMFELGNSFKVLTTTQLRNWTPHLQNYTILKDPRQIQVTKMVACHPVPYPYAVYYCHAQESENKLFMISLEGEKDGVRIEAVGICHMDTSQWNQDHVSFRVLGIEPGTSPVCHVFPQDNLVWVSSTRSV